MRGYLLTLLLLLAPVTPGLADTPSISIIIDDMGYRLRDDERAIRLPGRVTYAIMPFSPNAGRLAAVLQRLQKDVLLHMPMQSQKQEQNRFLGPGALTVNMNRNMFNEALLQAIDSVPGAIGMNNHMGSLLSRKNTHMQWLMEVLHSHRMFYVDSMTSRNGQASTAARRYRVPYMRRDIFLDNNNDVEYVSAQFDLLIATARRKGTAIAIGHPRPATLTVLEQKLPLLDEAGIKLVRLPELLETRTGQKLAQNRGPATEGRRQAVPVGLP